MTSTGARTAAPSWGIRLPNSGPHATVANIEAVAAAAVSHAFDVLWVHDHIPWATEMLTHFSTGSVEACADQDPNFFETIATVSHLAGRFPGIEVGIAGLVLPLRDPRVLAKQLMTAQVLTGERLITAVAIGNIPNDFEVMGVPFNQRGRITDEVLAALDAIYGNERSTHSGDRYSFHDAEFFPKPTGRRFWIAGNSPPAYRRIAEHGIGWLPGGMTPDEYADRRLSVREALEGRGRHIDDIECGAEVFCCLDDTTGAAERKAERSLALRFGTADRGVACNLIGDVERVAERVAQFRAAGVTHFELRFIAHDIDDHLDQLHQFATAVRPATAGAPT